MRDGAPAEPAAGPGHCSAPVNRILRSSIVDGPGNRAAVFLQGCNFHCPYCHNPETIALCDSCGLCVGRCPAGALRMEAGAACGALRWDPSRCTLCDGCVRACPRFSSPRVRTMTATEVMAEIAPSLPYIRGITVSGGECTLYPGFLRELGALAGERGLSFFIDTNGSYDFSADPVLLDRCGGIMPDIKADPDREDEYRRVTGAAAFDLLDRVLFLGRRGKLYEVRTVVSPGLFDAAALVEKVCRRLAGIRGLRYRLIRYRPAGVRPEAAAGLAAPDDALMAELAKIAVAAGLEAVVA